MIVFIDNPNFIQPIQYQFNRPISVYNLSSSYSGYIDITDLLTKVSPINNTGMSMPVFVQSVEFDMQYASAILNDPNLFCKLISVISASYEGYVVIILIKRDSYRDAIMESIIKLIQQRYGYNCWIVEDLEDIACVKETGYSPMGLIILNEDLQKYDSSYSDGNRISIE